MAASSSQRDTTRTSSPPPDQLASFHSLVDKSVNAGLLNRYARAVELSGKAAEKGEALFGDKSLVVARLRMQESMALASLAMEARGAEQQALRRRSWGACYCLLLQSFKTALQKERCFLAPSGKRSCTSAYTSRQRCQL